MLQYNFSVVGGSLRMDVVVTDGDYQPKSITFMQPSFRVATDKLRIYESGTYATELLFHQFGTISGETPTDLQDAEAKLLTAVANFNSGGESPLPYLTGLKPIVIHDPNGEYFTDQASALAIISEFNFPTPLESYYNSISKEFYIWYNSSYLEDLYIPFNTNTDLAFGYDNNISIQDESGFIYEFAGNAFQDNNKTEYSKPINLKVFYSNHQNALVNLHSDIKIEKCYSYNDNFGLNSSGNINIKYGYFNAANSFGGYLGNQDNILTIKHLDYVGGANFLNGFGGKVVIESINPTLLDTCPDDMFNTENPAILHLPFYAKGTNFGNIAETNIKASVATNQVVYDGLATPQVINYSTDEQLLPEKWIDNRDIYRKTFVLTELPSADTINFGFSSALIVDCKIFTDAVNSSYPYRYYGQFFEDLSYTITRDGLLKATSSTGTPIDLSTFQKITLTIDYTKSLE